MNIQKFTQKSIEAVDVCEKIAYEFGNQEIEEEHFLLALLRQEGGLIGKLVEKMGVALPEFTAAVEAKIGERTKVSGGQVFIGKDDCVKIGLNRKSLIESRFSRRSPIFLTEKGAA